MSDDVTMIGHNSAAFGQRIEAVDPRALAPDKDFVTQVLEHNYTGLTEQVDGFSDDVAEWVSRHEKTDGTLAITTEPDLINTKDFLDQITQFLADDVEATRVAVKACLLDAVAAVDDFFNDGIRDKVKELATPVYAAYQDYLKDQLGERKAALDQGVIDAKAEVDRLTALLEKTKNERARAAVNQKLQDAETALAEAEAAASGSVRDMTRVRGTQRVGGLRQDWTWELEQPSGLMDLIMAVASGQGVPREFLMPNRVEINRAVRKKNGLRKVPGLNIYAVEVAS
jgi:hypothetical protein